jgi:hypothetical protein
MFQEAKPRLLARYHHATQQALFNAAFMRATELSVIQAYLLYLVFRDDRLIFHSVNSSLLNPPSSVSAGRSICAHSSAPLVSRRASGPSLACIVTVPVLTCHPSKPSYAGGCGGRS